MRRLIIIFIVLMSFEGFGQKWHLNDIDDSEEFGYEYWFHFENIDDASSFEINTLGGRKPSTIRVTNNEGAEIFRPTLQLREMSSDSIMSFTTEPNGGTARLIKKGKYTLRVSAFGYDQIELQFEIFEDEFLELDVKLGLAPELKVYQINSKAALSETELKNIMDCVKENRQTFFKSCSKHDQYRIVIHA